MANEYCTLANLKAFAHITSTDASDDAVLSGLILSTSRGIDAFLFRKFYSRSETHTFDVPDYAVPYPLSLPGYAGNTHGRVLFLDDDLLSVTTLTNGDSTTIPSTEYNLYPLNEPAKRELRLKASSSYSFQSDTSGNNEGVISLAGVWGGVAGSPSVTSGWSGSASDAISGEIMSRLELATKIIATDLYKKRTGQSGEGAVTVTAAGVVIRPAGWPREALDLLLPLRHIPIAG